jgi:hypothetical protein
MANNILSLHLVLVCTWANTELHASHNRVVGILYSYDQMKYNQFLLHFPTKFHRLALKEFLKFNCGLEVITRLVGQRLHRIHQGLNLIVNLDQLDFVRQMFLLLHCQVDFQLPKVIQRTLEFQNYFLRDLHFRIKAFHQVVLRSNRWMILIQTSSWYSQKLMCKFGILNLMGSLHNSSCLSRCGDLP